MLNEFWLITWTPAGGDTDHMKMNIFKGKNLGEIVKNNDMVVRYAIQTNRESWKYYKNN